jgi:hypothetical protein
VIKEFVPAVEYLELGYDDYDWDVPFGASAGGLRYTCVRNKKHGHRITGGKEFISPMLTLKQDSGYSAQEEWADLPDDDPYRYIWLDSPCCREGSHRCAICLEPVKYHAEANGCVNCHDQQLHNIVMRERERE